MSAPELEWSPHAPLSTGNVRSGCCSQHSPRPDEVAEMAATPFREVFPPEPGFWCYRTPARTVPLLVSVWNPWLPLAVSPTAQTSLAETAPTAQKVELAPTLELGTTCQLVPFQCSRKACWVPFFMKSPTAQMELAETTATPERELPFEPGLGLVTTLQCEPFQCSIRVGQRWCCWFPRPRRSLRRPPPH